MRRVLLISRDPDGALRLATRQAEAGEHVTVVLVDGAAAVARAGHEGAAAITTASKAGVTVWAHHEALARRGVHEAVAEVVQVDLDAVAGLLSEDTDTVVWT